jgi:hypothetical protein
MTDEKPKGYLCGRINGCPDEVCKVWRDESKAAMPEIEWIDPMDNDFRGKEAESGHELIELDLRGVEESDFVLVNADVAGWGSGAEFHHAVLRDIPIVALCPRSKPISPWVEKRAAAVVHSIPEARAWIYDAFELEAA